jgi:cytochrome c biogenesis protein CcmG/thiol:disulfide interchange protein DsbE
MLRSMLSRLVFSAVLAVAVPAATALPAAAADASMFGSLSLKTLDGGAVSLQQLRGKVVLLNFWATWCKPCVAEMPVLASLAKKYHERGFLVVAASVDEPGSEEEIGRFAGKLPDGMQVWVGATLEDMSRLQVGSSLPVSILIDGGGRAVGARQGAIGEGLLDSAIEEALGKAPKKPKPLLGAEQAEAPRAVQPAATTQGAATEKDECCDAQGKDHAGGTGPAEVFSPLGSGSHAPDRADAHADEHERAHADQHGHGATVAPRTPSRVPS